MYEIILDLQGQHHFWGNVNMLTQGCVGSVSTGDAVCVLLIFCQSAMWLVSAQCAADGICLCLAGQLLASVSNELTSMLSSFRKALRMSLFRFFHPLILFKIWRSTILKLLWMPAVWHRDCGQLFLLEPNVSWLWSSSWSQTMMSEIFSSYFMCLWREIMWKWWNHTAWRI